MDPLSALREFTMRGEVEKIVRVNGEFRFGEEYTFPCWVETAYRSTKGNRYTLETLVHYIKNHHLKHTEYIQNTFAVGIPSVTLPDRKPLLQYLQGTLTSTDSIEYRPEDPSFAPKSTLPSQAQALPQPQEQPDKLDLISLITSVERPLKDRQSLLECKNRDFYSVLVSATKREEDRQRMESQQRKDGLVAKSRLMAADDRGLGFSDDMGGYDPTPKPKMLLKGTKIGEGVPIILVPSAFQTLITIYNVKEFLEDGVYIPTDVKVKQMKGTRPDCVTVQKKLSRDRVVTAYEVRDKPSSLKPDDWDRVVAVFVLGKEWQFKDWPFKDHVEIFNKIIGFYMRFEDDSLESAKNVKQWNVKIISISKNKRHQDRAAALDVWERLEEFARARSRS
ncbi:protein CDC73 homolog [Vigna unguiculata]|uniref:Parafibromin n=1 Tax=Vigna unguiculata TaxID=3917 RepID=A0A4D6LUW9_VIGUN|nr:protein CDC73 homolog [Vigna unguiculata]XP_027913726.1 protein CDC73 homolog [Vigna unguiculata]QCD91816.1 parafibromin [Vigna unguiculata]